MSIDEDMVDRGINQSTLCDEAQGGKVTWDISELDFLLADIN